MKHRLRGVHRAGHGASPGRQVWREGLSPALRSRPSGVQSPWHSSVVLAGQSEAGARVGGWVVCTRASGGALSLPSAPGSAGLSLPSAPSSGSSGRGQERGPGMGDMRPKRCEHPEVLRGGGAFRPPEGCALLCERAPLTAGDLHIHLFWSQRFEV